MGTIRVGTCGLRTGRDEYARSFGVLELPETFRHLPPLAEAQRWRAALPHRVELTMRAHRSITDPEGGRAARGRRTREADHGGFRDSPLVRRTWKRMVELTAPLDVRIIVFRSPASFRPTDENIANLIRFFSWAHRDRLRFAWEPRGAEWTDEIVRELCRELSLSHVVDPLEREPMRGRPPYFHLRGVGDHRRAYTDNDLHRLHDLCIAERPMCDDDGAYCLFNNAAMEDDARRFAELPHHTPAPPLPPGEGQQ
jgi:uncharacterized protein YecE (DUF72 family)